MSNNEIIELPKVPNVKFVLDGQGRGWYCHGSASSEGDLASQGCVLGDSVVYDRGFGG